MLDLSHAGSMLVVQPSLTPHCPPDEQLVSGSYDSTVKVWDLQTGVCLTDFADHTGPVNCLEMLDDGRLVSGSGDATLRIWDPRQGGRPTVILKVSHS